jgi:hypothetical protein
MKNKYNFFCEPCNYKCLYKSEYTKHLNSSKHKRGGKPLVHKCYDCNYSSTTSWKLKMHIVNRHMTNDQKNQLKYYCNICDFLCFSQLYYNKHMEGNSHRIKVDNSTNNELNKTNDNIDSNIKDYIDECFRKLINKLKISIDD